MTKSLQKKIDKLPHTPGVYIFRDRNAKPLYVGKSIDVNKRVKSYFQTEGRLPPKTAQMIDKIHDVEVIDTQSEIEALLLEATVIQALRPKFNTALKDDKRYKYIVVTDSITSRKTDHHGLVNNITHPAKAYPHIETSRKSTNPNNSYFGPFPSGGTVNEVTRFLRKIFGWCAYKSLREVEKADKPCFYHHINQCPGYCAGEITHNEYLEHVDRLIRFLSGEHQEIINELETKMQSAADEQKYEKAQKFRDQIENLNYITQQFRPAESFVTNPVLEEEQFYFARKQLQEVLGEINPQWAQWLRNLERIEAYDISNLQGKQATGSMVVLIDGFPVNSLYRRFKINDMDEPDDFAMMNQVIARRFKHIKDEFSTDDSFSQIPQLLVIDGGKGQVSAVLDALEAMEIDLPVIGLAKREEQIIVPILDNDAESYKTITIPHDSPSLHLLQRIRDEAHRFAKKYHVLLRKKNMGLS